MTAHAWPEAHLTAHLEAATSMRELLPQLREVTDLLCERFAQGGILYTFGNGGSAADAQHLTGEIIGHYKRDRRPLGAVTLSTDPTTMTCIANDYAYEDVFARQVQALASPRDVIAAFTTSGRSANITRALEAGRAAGSTIVLFAGGDGGPAASLADRVLLAPASATPRIQEMHTFMLHVISEGVDAWAAGEEPF
jgi:D-sedoheptulose 7-phosphate isomerase